MEELATINKRTIGYQRHSLDINWAKSMPDENWLLLVMVEGKNKTILDEISRKAIDHNVCYICCAGEQSELLHDMIDEEITFRNVDIDDLHLPDHFILIAWNKKIEETLWHAIFVAHNDEEEIKAILCLDASLSGVKSKLEKLIATY